MPGQTSISEVVSLSTLLLQWRAGQLPGQTCDGGDGGGVGTVLLQWRAGQLPGQTGPLEQLEGRVIGASMEGRTIARPDLDVFGRKTAAEVVLQWRAGQLPGQTHGVPGRAGARDPASMEGRTIARPDPVLARVVTRGMVIASMEGRTIARPDHHG